ncbi:uncharacterized protein LOC110984468 [Acanthaster planci]|uniref:Uncharacterized protein LOC110984468 n=1 Tax=Acanthaster planci TaxID=133434 RepID=A0A8B7Z416_ACAPL|nr:uncharacterized protein LOC110984468 [Acanthaster planci]
MYSGTSRNSSARSSKSKITRRLAEQESRRKLEELRRKAEEERAKVQFQAKQMEIQINSDLRRAEIELETERLRHEIDVIYQEEKDQTNVGGHLPGQVESVKDRTFAWVNEGVSTSEPSVSMLADIGMNTSVNLNARMPEPVPLMQHSMAIPMTSVNPREAASQHTSHVMSSAYVSHGAASTYLPGPASAHISHVMSGAYISHGAASTHPPGVINAPVSCVMADSYVSHQAAGVQVASSLPQVFNPNASVFLPNTVLVQSLPTVRLFSDMPVSKFSPTSGASAMEGVGSQSPTQHGAPRQQSTKNGKVPEPSTSREDTDTSSGEEQGESSSSNDDDPSKSDKGSKHSHCSKA